MGLLLLPHIDSATQLNQAIRAEPNHLVMIRFGRERDGECMRQDDVLARISPLMKSHAIIYLCDPAHVPDFAAAYELSEPLNIMLFFRGKHIKCDLGTGDNNKITWVLGKQELVDIVEVVYRGARKGRGQVDSPRDYSTKGRW